MGLFLKRDWAGASANDLIPQRSGTVGGRVGVTTDSALRHSAVWACLRLRADMVSSMPIDCYRKVSGWQVETPKPPVLVNPGGERVDITEWMYSSQVDLDRYGNAFGIITERDGNRLPSRIDLVSAGGVSVRQKNGELTYRINGKPYAPEDIWHEKQFTVAGLPVGLSPIAYAAWSIGGYLSAQDFVLNWFDGGAVPSAQLKNTQKIVPAKEAAAIKERFKASVQNGDVFVTGSDWEYTMVGIPANDAQFLEEMKYGLPDVCRFLGVPADMIDAETSSGSITYANVTQRNLQLLVINLAPTIYRRERALSNLLQKPRFVKLNTDALLRMDPQTRAQVQATLVGARLRSPDEVREKDNLPPFTPEQIDQLLLLEPPKYPNPLKPAAEPGVTPAEAQ
jgi:HK97 family phage portal protein